MPLIFLAAILIPPIPLLRAEEANESTELNNQAVHAAQAGRLEEAILLLRRAMKQDPSDSLIRKNLSGVETDWAVQLDQRGAVDKAKEVLQEALQLDPDNGKALVLLGDLVYVSQNDLARSIALWKQANGKIPSDQWAVVSPRLSQAERDLAIERRFVAHQTPHFYIRFEAAEGADVKLAQTLGEALEQEYARLSDILGQAPQSFPVIVYSNDNFSRIAGRRDWASGLYDGRIRLRMEDLEGNRFQPVLAHEMSHAFLSQIYGPRIPIWVHEGFAQVQEPFRVTSPRQQEFLDGITSGTSWVPLSWINQRFERPSDLDALGRAYLQAWWVVDRLIHRYGMDRFRQFLKRLSSGEPIEQAFDQEFSRMRWAQVQQGHLE